MATSRVASFTMYSTWKWELDKASGQHVAYCDELKLTAEGETFGELAETILEVQTSYFHYLAKEGLLEEFLDEHGVDYQTDSGHEDDAVRFNVPPALIPAAHAANREAHC